MFATLQPVHAPYIEPFCHATVTTKLVVAAVLFVALGAIASLGAEPAPRPPTWHRQPR